MATRSELALLSAVSYDKEDVPPGWEALDVPLPEGAEKSSFGARVFRRGDEIVVAYTGTNDSKDIFGADKAIAHREYHPQFLQALDFMETVTRTWPDHSIVVTGHSLGGAHAQIAADAFGLTGCTFDAPGMAWIADDLTLKRFLKTFDPLSDGSRPTLDGRAPGLDNVRVMGSTISIVGDHIGDRPEMINPPGALYRAMRALALPLPAGFVADQVGRHSIDGIVEYYRKLDHDQRQEPLSEQRGQLLPLAHGESPVVAQAGEPLWQRLDAVAHIVAATESQTMTQGAGQIPGMEPALGAHRMKPEQDPSPGWG